MKIKINDYIPDTKFYRITDSGPKVLKTSEIFNGKKLILVGVPGAFTPTCSDEHLPGFLNDFTEFVKKGIDQIIFVSVNDPFVLNEWIKTKKADEISYLADPFCDFGEKTGLTLDLTVIGLGKRLSRFAMLVDNGKVIKLFDEDGGGLDKSSAKSVIEAL